MVPEISTEPVLTSRASSELSVLVAVYFRLETVIEAAADSSPQVIVVLMETSTAVLPVAS